MSVDRCIACSASEIFVVFVSDVFFLLAYVLFGKTKVDHIYLCDILFATYQEVVWLYVAVQNTSRMDKFDQLKHFETDQYSCLD